jgi:hypothetical protein
MAGVSPFDYISKPQLQQQVKSLVSEACVSGVRIQQLRTLHRSMMKHQKNQHDLFNIPVDPIAFNIPDYDKVITEPMDLGLVKTRLEEVRPFRSFSHSGPTAAVVYFGLVHSRGIFVYRDTTLPPRAMPTMCGWCSLTLSGLTLSATGSTQPPPPCPSSSRRRYRSSSVLQCCNRVVCRC